jgi:hypothetical protein
MGVLTDFFRLSKSELRSTFAAWKVPLDEPVRRPGVNPFTKQPIEVLSWDPDPQTLVEDSGPAGPPRPSIDMKGLGHEAVVSLIKRVHDPSPETEAQFFRPALIGPDEGPWINELPPAFVSKLAALDDAAMARVAAEWSLEQRSDIETTKDDFTRQGLLARRPPAYWHEVALELRSFARATIAEDRRMYMWVCV